MLNAIGAPNQAATLRVSSIRSTNRPFRYSLALFNSSSGTRSRGALPRVSKETDTVTT